MRGWQKTLLTALALLLLLTAGAYWYLQKTLAALPMQNLQYQISGIGLRQLQLSSVSFTLDTPAVQVQLNNISLNWQLADTKLTQVRLGSGTIHLLQWPEATTDTPTSAPVHLPTDWQLPAAFPDHIDINELGLDLPCGQTVCRYLLWATLNNTEQLQYQLTAASADTPDIRRLSISGNYRTIQQLPVFNASINLDNSAQLQLSQQLSGIDDISASGELTLDIAPPSPWLLQQLQWWQAAIPEDALARFTAPVTVRSDWQVQLPKQPTLANIAAKASGNWQLQAELPSPLAIPGVGQLQGNVSAKLGLQQGELSQYQLNSQLTLLQPRLSGQLLQLGINADAVHITVVADGQTTPQLTALPLQLGLSTHGATMLTISGDATLNLTPPMTAQLRNGKLSLAQQQLKPLADTILNKLDVQSRFNAYWLADRWQLDLQTLTASIAALNSANTQARDVRVNADSTSFSGDTQFSRARLQANLSANVGQLLQPDTKPLSWQWQATLNGSPSELTLEGRLSNSASLGIVHQLRYSDSKLALNWQLDDIFLLAGNPLAATFSSWPPLLDFNRGRINATGEVTLLPAINAKADVNLSGINGIYDRSLFKDLTATLQLEYHNEQLHLSTSSARLSEINHGIVAGPLLLSANYRANVDAMSAGKLDIQQLQLKLMGGEAQLQPQLLDLALSSQQLQVTLKQIEISQLLQQHPSTDISGNGRISGNIPLLLGRAGVSVEQGIIAAESPGGQLQYRPAAAQGMAASNQGMKVVLNALDDFHYTVLSSNVSYDTSGKLLLALQLQGSNPALEAGRAINLNINLEEDIPALITSLQLSSQISDKIKQRVQQRLQQQGAKNAKKGVQP